MSEKQTAEEFLEHVKAGRREPGARHYVSMENARRYGDMRAEEERDQRCSYPGPSQRKKPLSIRDNIHVWFADGVWYAEILCDSGAIAHDATPILAVDRVLGVYEEMQENERKCQQQNAALREWAKKAHEWLGNTLDQMHNGDVKMYGECRLCALVDQGEKLLEHGGMK